MPRQKSLVTLIRDLVRTEIQNALAGIFRGLGVDVSAKSATSATKAKPKNGRRRRRKTTTSASAASGAKRGRPGGRRKGPAASEV